MGLFGGGEVGPTPQEQVLASTFTQQFQDYQKRWLPIADHLGDVVSSMAPGKDSWQRAEAEGKGNADTAMAFAQDMAQRSASLSSGVNAGSSRFKLGVAGAATAEAESKGISIESGNQQITSAYLKGLQSLTAQGGKLAAGATQGMDMAAQITSHEAINNAQVQNSANSGAMQAVGFGIGALGASAMSPSPGGGPMTDLGGGYGLQIQQNMAQGGGTSFGAGSVENLPGV